ncbi:hypothetical protein [Neobacillus vireti]|uniref:Uncharacterized protein n=1 Tax=Neobacillus vireti LMG 21834 TaxID=1131730 RepID=A0AB94IRM5_9BACI|nr:hypothetical protein [Neobacillus vireti]ETI69731.1 hypothetical protein BAVI_05979 [Neobacillus vireti LMG 21834]KLT19670.1 hypothetical protein AA980_03550 [Neobacillus vireti]
MPSSQSMIMNADEQDRLMEWWNKTEEAKIVVQRLMSLITELRVHPESSHADGMVLFYRAASEISYGYAGMRGCIRRSFTSEYSEPLRKNIVMCHSFAHKYSVDAKILLERVAKHVTEPNGLQLINRIRDALMENDAMLNEIAKKANAFFGKETFQSIQTKVNQSITLPSIG